MNTNEVTTEIRSTRIIRPFKPTALICGIISLIFGITCLFTDQWISTSGYNQGLWKFCSWNIQDLNPIVICENVTGQAWVIACSILTTIAVVLQLCAVILNTYGLLNRSEDLKPLIYRIAAFVMVSAVIMVLLTSIVFPIMFVKDLHSKNKLMYGGEDTWYIGWSYGICWSSAVFGVGCAVLLFSKQESSQIYYKERTFTNGVRTE